MGAKMDDDGWVKSASAWIAEVGEHGDWGRKNVLDHAMLARLEGRSFARALDVGCGEGRFCRMLKTRGIANVGIDPTEPLLDAARQRDPDGEFLPARAEALPFDDAAFDLVVSYLTLIDIPDYRSGIREMARVLAPGGTLLIANLTSMATAGAETGWVPDDEGRPKHYPVDRYLDEFSMRLAWSGIEVVNWHRPLSAYMKALLGAELVLVHFDEPEAQADGDEPERIARYHRMPWFNVMEWRKRDTVAVDA
jgi:ubiquinone/menaquinone biosynthesis C-methylase UbiE